MAFHEYSPREALALLLKKISACDSDLAIGLQAAIDAGTDVLEGATIAGSRKQRKYRKTVRFTDEEALRIVIQALEAHFVEQPLFANSAVGEFANATLGAGGARHGRSSFNQPRSETVEATLLDLGLELELQTETQVAREDKNSDPETVPFSPHRKVLIEEQKANIKHLSELVEFGRGRS